MAPKAKAKAPSATGATAEAAPVQVTAAGRPTRSRHIPPTSAAEPAAEATQQAARKAGPTAKTPKESAAALPTVMKAAKAATPAAVKAGATKKGAARGTAAGDAAVANAAAAARARAHTAAADREEEAALASVAASFLDEKEDDAAISDADDPAAVAAAVAAASEELKPKTKTKKLVHRRPLRIYDNLPESEPGLTPGVVVISRIPFGFFEEPMRKFFSQFGDIRRLRLARNPKARCTVFNTGKSRHYAFIEFASDDVAKIVADTMDNYMMFGRLLKCKFMPPEHVHPNTFVGAGIVIRPGRRRERALTVHNKERSKDEMAGQVRRLLAKEQKKKDALKALGLDYDFGGYATASAGATPAAAPAGATVASTPVGATPAATPARAASAVRRPARK